MMPSLLLPFFSRIAIALVVPLVHPSFWTRWQHVLLVHVHGVVLSQAAFAWEMSISSTALEPGLHPQALLLIQELELEG